MTEYQVLLEIVAGMSKMVSIHETIILELRFADTIKLQVYQSEITSTEPTREVLLHIWHSKDLFMKEKDQPK